MLHVILRIVDGEDRSGVNPSNRRSGQLKIDRYRYIDYKADGVLN